MADALGSAAEVRHERWPDTVGWRVWDYDPAAADEERAQWEVPPLAELLERVKGLGGGRTHEEIALDPFVTIEFGGRRLSLRLLANESWHLCLSANCLR